MENKGNFILMFIYVCSVWRYIRIKVIYVRLKNYVLECRACRAMIQKHLLRNAVAIS